MVDCSIQLLIAVNGRLLDPVFVLLVAGNLFSLIPSTSSRRVREEMVGGLSRCSRSNCYVEL